MTHALIRTTVGAAARTVAALATLAVVPAVRAAVSENLNDGSSAGTRFAEATGSDLIVDANPPYNNNPYSFTADATYTQVIVADTSSGLLTHTAGTLSTTLVTVARTASSSGTYILSGGTLSTQAVHGGAGTSAFRFDGGTLRAAANNTDFMSGLIRTYVNANVARIDTNGFNVTVSQALEHDPNASDPDGGLTKSNSGTLTLTGSSTYTGGTSVNAGTLEVGTGGRITGSGISVSAGATLAVSGTGKVNPSGGATINGSLTVADTADVQLASNLVLNAGAVTQSGGSLYSSSDFNGNDAGTSYTLSGGTVSVNDAYGFGTTFVQSGGTFTARGGLNIGYNGSYTLSGGTLVSNQSYIGYSTGTQYNFTQTGGSHTTNLLAIVGDGTDNDEVATYTLSNGTLDVNGNTRIGQTNTAGVLTQNGGTNTTNSITVRRGTYNLKGGTLRSGPITSDSSSALSVFNFNGGTLEAFDRDSTTSDIGTLMSGLTTASVQAGGAKIDTAGHAATISQVLSHDAALGATADGGLTKNGAGTLRLTGNNTYTGGTTVNAGTLRANNATSSTGTGAVTVNNNAALGGNGTIGDGVANNAADLVTVNTGGTITAGADDATTGTLTTDRQKWNAGGKYAWKLADPSGTAGSTGGWDLLSMTTLDLTGVTPANRFQINASKLGGALSGLAVGQKFLIADLSGTATLPDGSSIADLFVLNTAALVAGSSYAPQNFELSFSGGDVSVVYTAAPEPGTIVLGGLAGLPALMRRRKRTAA